MHRVGARYNSSTTALPPCYEAPTTCTSTDLFNATVKLIAASQCCFVDNFKSDEIQDKDYFDFIIVGGGSAGSVVANRLSEVKKWKILLLEAGSKMPIVASVPHLNNYIFDTKNDWNYTTLNNNKTSQALKNGQTVWHRGKGLGGCSAIDGMLYLRGRKSDYESWHKQGNPSWTPENVYMHFKKAESLQNEELESNPDIKRFYGENGYQVINRINTTHRPVQLQVLKSFKPLGIDNVTDINSAEYKYPGMCGISTMTAATGLRYGTDKSYILPATNRSNLIVVTETYVTKVLLKNNKAYGVEVVNIRNDQKKQLFVNYEVIVCGGTINSPKLLMLSGIGPKNHLESQNISCKVNLPAVGKNLQDHLRVLVPVFGNRSSYDDIFEKNCSVENYCYNRTGYLAQGNLDDILTFYSLNPNLDYPEFQNHFSFIFGNLRNFFNSLGYKESVTDSIIKSNENKTLYAIYVTLLHPHSRGSILLNTSDPMDKPLIDANYFGDERDLVLVARGILFTLKILQTEFFKSINAFVPRIKWRECDKYTFNTTEYWMCYAKNLVTTIYHPAGTCKMGPSPQNSVVNNFLEVHETKNLRVIDASVMPDLPSGNTNGPTIMIGEMGASMIKKKYNE